MNVEEIIAYLEAAIATFERDPADGDFQAGYLTALQGTLIAVKCSLRLPQ